MRLEGLDLLDEFRRELMCGPFYCEKCHEPHYRYRDRKKLYAASYCCACHAAYQRENRKPYSEYTPEQRFKARSRNIAAYHHRKGDLVQEPCEACGAEDSEKHHDDYDKPLEVRWLCRPCHLTEHYGRDQ